MTLAPDETFTYGGVEWRVLRLHADGVEAVAARPQAAIRVVQFFDFNEIDVTDPPKAEPGGVYVDAFGCEWISVTDGRLARNRFGKSRVEYASFDPSAFVKVDDK